MNVRLLKAKRVQLDILQSEIADVLGITPKSACEKENSERCRYTVEEMLKLTKCLKLTQKEFDDIFFDSKLTDCYINSSKTNSFAKNQILKPMIAQANEFKKKVSKPY